MFEPVTSRRSFIKAAGISSAALAASTSAGMALADESGSYTYADTIAWDAEYDVVVIGLGFAGMAAATGAADAGAGVLVCEKGPQGEEGGNSRFCGQMFAYANDDEDAALDYYHALAAGRSIDEEVVDVMARSVAHMATTLSEKYGLNRDEFTDETGTALGYMSPEYPEFPGSDKMGLWSTNDAYGDSHLYQSMRERLAADYADKVDVWFGSPVTDLIQEPTTKAIIGVKVKRNGEVRNVRALNGVCVCCGGFECNPKMVQDFLGLHEYVVAVSLHNEGDGLRMTQAVGARLWHADVYEGVGCTWYYCDTATAVAKCTMPAGIARDSSMVVGCWGKRFFNETETARHGHVSLGNGSWDNPTFPEHTFFLIDQTKMDEITEAGGFSEDYADDVIACADVAEAAAAIGCEEADLQQTIDDFNADIEAGRDRTCGRDVSTMRAFDGQGYYVIKCLPGILNTQGGPERNAKAEIIGQDGEPLPHLYGAGECGGFTVNMYQGGTNVAECFIFGDIAGQNAAAEKDPLPAYVAAEKVESNPKKLGEETDLTA